MNTYTQWTTSLLYSVTENNVNAYASQSTYEIKKLLLRHHFSMSSNAPSVLICVGYGSGFNTPVVANTPGGVYTLMLSVRASVFFDGVRPGCNGVTEIGSGGTGTGTRACIAPPPCSGTRVFAGLAFGRGGALLGLKRLRTRVPVRWIRERAPSEYRFVLRLRRRRKSVR